MEELALVGDTRPRVVASHGKHHYYLNVKEGVWRWAWLEIRDPVSGFICGFFGCPWPEWILIFETLENTNLAPGAVVPVLEMPYPTPSDPVIPTNLGRLTEGLDLGSFSDPQLECALRTAQFDAELIDSIKIGGAIRGVRAMAETAYLVVGDGQGKEVVVLLGSALSTAGSHDVGQWLFGEQSDSYRARLLPGGHAEAAWIHR